MPYPAFLDAPANSVRRLGSGKTSFLRLLLDTSAVSTSATPDDVASVAKFVQGCSGHTTHIRTASIDVDVDLDGTGLHRRFGLNLIDTPTLDFADERAADRLVADTMHLVESRFLESVDDVSAGLPRVVDSLTDDLCSPG